MEQELAKKLSDSDLNGETTRLLFELSRAKNSVMSRTPAGNYYGGYVIYSINEVYIAKLIKNLQKDGYWATVIGQEIKKDQMTWLKINWRSKYFKLPDST